MFIIKTNHKKIKLSIAITQLLAKYECTFSETEHILSLLKDEFRMQRENIEYKNIDNLINGNKICCADDMLVSSLKFTPDYSEIN